MTNPTSRQVWAYRPAPAHAPLPPLLMPVALGDTLNAGAFGGTATVHRILTQPYHYMAAKVFNDDVLASRRTPAVYDKLSMIAAASEGLKRGYVGAGVIEPPRPFVTWPEALLFDANKADLQHLVGFAMPLVADGLPLSKLTSPKHRKAQFPGLASDGLMCAAQNIAQAVSILHGADGRSGIVIGDLTPRNILIMQDLRCHLIDADSYQLATSAKVFGSADSTPGFRSPRIAAAARTGGVLPAFTHADDAYCLALVLFHVLVDGAHPWIAGERYEAAGAKPDEEDNMLAKRFPYTEPATYFPPKIRLQTYQKLHQKLRKAFEQAFLGSTPPTAAEWVQALVAARAP